MPIQGNESARIIISLADHHQPPFFSAMDNDKRDLFFSSSSSSATITPPADLLHPNSRATETRESDLAKEIEAITSYKFKNVSLLERAFTDFSREENCNSFQRLEFYGDSVLNHLVAEKLFSEYKDLHSGQLTRLRAANVDTEKLARAAIKHKFHRYLQHKKPLLAGQIKEFKEAILEYPLHSYGLIDAPKALANIVESFIGALHIDCCSWDTTAKVVKKLLQPLITPETLQLHPVTKLYELCQKNGWKIDFVDHNWKKKGEIEVYIEDELVGKGRYNSKKLIAYNRAADDAYKKISTKAFTVKKKDDDNDQLRHVVDDNVKKNKIDFHIQLRD